MAGHIWKLSLSVEKRVGTKKVPALRLLNEHKKSVASRLTTNREKTVGRVKDWQIDEERIKFERAEAAYFALPEAQAKALEGIHELLQSRNELVEQNVSLKSQVGELQKAFVTATSSASRWRERGIGFAFGIAASVVASFIFGGIVKRWPFLG